jgi:hypothetical protein
MFYEKITQRKEYQAKKKLLASPRHIIAVLECIIHLDGSTLAYVTALLPQFIHTAEALISQIILLGVCRTHPPP